MERNLMAPDEFKNLGFTEEDMAKYEAKKAALGGRGGGK
jgi:hypothetical protein